MIRPHRSNLKAQMSNLKPQISNPKHRVSNFERRSFRLDGFVMAARDIKSQTSSVKHRTSRLEISLLCPSTACRPAWASGWKSRVGRDGDFLNSVPSSDI